jgi:hypothetical protein
MYRLFIDPPRANFDETQESEAAPIVFDGFRTSIDRMNFFNACFISPATRAFGQAKFLDHGRISHAVIPTGCGQAIDEIGIRTKTFDASRISSGNAL